MVHNTKKWLEIATTALTLSVGMVQVAWAVDAVTTSPTKVYLSVGDTFSFTVTLPAGNATSDTDLLVSHTANTTSPSITPYALCIDAATPAPYNGAPPNTKYVNWSAGVGIFPSAPACGAQLGAITLATFSGVAATIPGGKYTVQVLNGFANADPNVASNDVTVCQKRTVASITPPANFVEGAANTGFIITLDQAVVAGCGGFSVPFTISGAAVAGKTASVTPASSCTFADGATSCTVAVTTVDNASFEGTQALVLTVTDSVAASTYISTGKTASTNVLDNETAPAASITYMATPTSLTFAGVTAGTPTATQSVTVAANAANTGALNVASCAFAGANAADFSFFPTPAFPVSVAAGASSALQVRFTPAAANSAARTATLTCQTPNATAAGAGSFTVNLTGNNPATVVSAVTPAGAVTLPAFSIGIPSSSTPLSFNVTGGPAILTCTASGAGYTATPSPLNLVVGTPGVVTVTYTGSTVGTFNGGLNCSSSSGGQFVYTLSTTVTAAPPANVAVPTMDILGLSLMSLMLTGLAGFQQRRRRTSK